MEERTQGVRDYGRIYIWDEGWYHMEIGSIYEVDPALEETGKTDGNMGEKPSLAEVRKYGKEYCVYTASCREAVALALKSLEEHRANIPKRCLLPAYMCDSVFTPFEQAGWELYFYHMDKKLTVREEELRSLIGEVRPGLLFIHPYYGVDTWKPIRPLLTEWKAQGICIMEDVTQSYYLEGAGAEADYVVGSLRKWYPVPDGGFVASEEKMTDDGLGSPAAYVQMRLEAMEEKWRYLNGTGSSGGKSPEERQEIKFNFLKKSRDAEEELDRYSGIRRLSGTAAHILKKADEEAAKERRSGNYNYLYGKLRGRTQFTPILEIGGEEAGIGTGSAGEKRDARPAPLYFAIYAREREKLQGYLREQEIFAPVLWPVGKANGKCLTEDEIYIYEHMLALPIDQRYGIEEMRHIAEAMEEYERRETEISGEEETGSAWKTAAGDGRNGQEADRPDMEEGVSPGQVIGIRTDANETVATGHIMRCITIAKQLKQKGCQVVFFTADEYGREWLEQAGMDMVCLRSEWNCMENEIPLLRKALQNAGCKKLLVDSYQVSIDYFDKLRDLCELIYIDDCFEGIYPVDMLINYNAYHVRFPYEEAYKGKAKLLLGTSYVPLRDEFRRQDGEESGGKISGEVQHVIISSGGGDRYDALSGILAEAAEDAVFRNVVFHAVVGKFHNGKAQLERLAAGYPNIRLHEEVKDMAGLMASCHGAVSAAGTMLFELSAMGIPTVFFVSADNQQYDCEFFAAEDRMLFAGDIRTDRHTCIREVCNGLKKILGNEKLQGRMRDALYRVTDGRGAERIAQAIRELQAFPV